MDREKVIKELESLRDICNAKSNMAIGNGKVAWAGYANTADDALAMLKEQEAKLLTFDEVKKHYSIPDELTGNLMESIDYSYDIAPLYMECPDEDQWVVHWRDYRSIEQFLEDWQKEYGKTWRCWTAKPTAEQRSAAKWN